MNKLIKLFLLIVVYIFPLKESCSQETKNPTTVFGEAQNSDGTENVFILHQPNNSQNPLGNPIYIPPETTNNSSKPNLNNVQEPSNANISSDNSLENKVVPPSEAELLGKKFQNTLIEANGMVYDIQAYPTKDLNVIGDPANPETIYSPNVNP